ncbi:MULTISPECIES: hypothetical protein [unclassified Paenibacillus]|uniref:helix-turn-helix domain-containing protein n=1 Tax=unclassified Paenibacillus TaxID=185978 RepID=UPI001AE204C4|nr:MULTISPECIES: hypothetical protein [unclassified Paenibacillus]MBP1157644.1 hypothetical protein [Paenibacillus sp. PvP091]MBP1171619.1 hypothetical protein [Paenibacillus sp. PvR098]MBP2438000.1 hypothetical protein [Paenibacillus sp. PvP052]
MYKYEFVSLPEVDEFIKEIEERKNRGDKDAKIMFDKIIYCMERVRLQGTRAGAIARFEGDTTVPRIDTIIRVAMALGVDLTLVPSEHSGHHQAAATAVYA